MPLRLDFLHPAMKGVVAIKSSHYKGKGLGLTHVIHASRGFAVAPNIIVTCTHCLFDDDGRLLPNLELYTSSGTFGIDDADIYAHDLTDIAVINLSRPRLRHILPLASTTPQPGDIIRMVQPFPFWPLPLYWPVIKGVFKQRDSVRHITLHMSPLPDPLFFTETDPLDPSREILRFNREGQDDCWDEELGTTDDIHLYIGGKKGFSGSPLLNVSNQVVGMINRAVEGELMAAGPSAYSLHQAIANNAR